MTYAAPTNTDRVLSLITAFDALAKVAASYGYDVPGTNDQTLVDLLLDFATEKQAIEALASEIADMAKFVQEQVGA